MKPILLHLASLFLLHACSTTPKSKPQAPVAAAPMDHLMGTAAERAAMAPVAAGTPSASATPEKVYTPVGKVVKRPAWIDPKNPFQLKGGEVHALGTTVTPPGAGVDEGYIIASNSAKDVICKAVQYRLDFIFQDSEEGSSVDHKQIREIGMDICTSLPKVTHSGQKYWEKVMTTASNGDRVVVYRVFVTDVIPEKKFKSLVAGTIKMQEGKGDIPKGYAREFRKRWAAFLKGE
jgi:hypothetical protein